MKKVHDAGKRGKKRRDSSMKARMNGITGFMKSLISKIKSRERRLIITIISGTLLLILYCIIFSFSKQTGEESGSISRYISEKYIGALNSLTGERWRDALFSFLVEHFESPLRKLAHFIEYTCMGVLVSLLLAQWMKQGKRLYFGAVLWVFVSAALDEFHQYFVPGRHGSLTDVCIDSCGGVFGMLICLAVLRRFHSFFSWS